MLASFSQHGHNRQGWRCDVKVSQSAIYWSVKLTAATASVSVRGGAARMHQQGQQPRSVAARPAGCTLAFRAQAGKIEGDSIPDCRPDLSEPLLDTGTAA